MLIHKFSNSLTKKHQNTHRNITIVLPYLLFDSQSFHEIMIKYPALIAFNHSKLTHFLPHSNSRELFPFLLFEA